MFPRPDVATWPKPPSEKPERRVAALLNYVQFLEDLLTFAPMPLSGGALDNWKIERRRALTAKELSERPDPFT